MDVAALLSILLLVGLLGGMGAYLVVAAKRGEQEAQQQQEAPPPAPRAPGGRFRQRRAGQGRQPQAHSSDAETDGEDDQDGEVVAGGTRQQRVEARRRARQMEREEEREAELAQREARQSKHSAYEERQRLKEEEREERERLEEEERLRKAEERRKQEEEEAEKWREFISVDATGEDESEANTEGLLHKFVDVIKDRKMVVLEDLAIEFGMRTHEVIQRIEQLEKMGRITGVMDDRGKFIYISRKEMESVRDFIRARGRIGISELAYNSNMFVDLEAKKTDADLPEIDLNEYVDEPNPPRAAAAAAAAL